MLEKIVVVTYVNVLSNEVSGGIYRRFVRLRRSIMFQPMKNNLKFIYYSKTTPFLYTLSIDAA